MSYDSAEKAQVALPWEVFQFSTTGQTFYLTSADAPIVYAGNTYVPTTLRREEMTESVEVNAGEIKVYIPAAHPLAQLFIAYLPPVPMSVIMFAGHYGDDEVLALFAGSVASSIFTDECQLVCRSDKYLLQQKIPTALYQPLCNHVFGDEGCGINLAAYTTTGVISDVDPTGTIITVPAFDGMAHPLAGGWLQHAKGIRLAVAHAGPVITLAVGIAGIVVGDACTGVSGCQHTYLACKSYNNVSHYLGFDLIPNINPFTDPVT